LISSFMGSSLIATQLVSAVIAYHCRTDFGRVESS
jgi:hypothetical protein